MQKIMIILLTTFLCFNLAGCETKQDQGVLAGVAAGALVGSQFGHGDRTAGIVTGALIGGMLGGAVGKNMDDIDRLNMNRAISHRETATWTNPHTGYNYTVVPGNNVSYGNNPNCREYNTTASIGGRQERVFGVACRQSDGSWRIVN